VTDTSPDLAPDAPGSLAAPGSGTDLRAYLEQLTSWVAESATRLDGLDRRARAASNPDQFTPDVLLAYTLHKAIAERAEALVHTYDNGRLDDQVRDELSTLIFSRLSAGSLAGLSASLPEACSLLGALLAQITQHLAHDAVASSNVADRIEPLRGTLRRCVAKADALADQTFVATAQSLTERLGAAVTTQADRLDELFPEIEQQSWALERDLDLEAARRSRIEQQRSEQRALVQQAGELATKARAVRDRCIEKIADPPRMAVPDPSVLPNDDAGGLTATDIAALEKSLPQWRTVVAALTEALTAFQAPLDQRDELRGLFTSYEAMAADRHLLEVGDVAVAHERAKTLLWSQPLDLSIAEQMVRDFQSSIHAASGPRRSTR
jgi:hypothetical protein